MAVVSSNIFLNLFYSFLAWVKYESKCAVYKYTVAHTQTIQIQNTEHYRERLFTTVQWRWSAQIFNIMTFIVLSSVRWKTRYQTILLLSILRKSLMKQFLSWNFCGIFLCCFCQLAIIERSTEAVRKRLSSNNLHLIFAAILICFSTFAQVNQPKASIWANCITKRVPT